MLSKTYWKQAYTIALNKKGHFVCKWMKQNRMYFPVFIKFKEV